MNQTVHEQAYAELLGDWMTWLVLRHLLPIAGQRELAKRVVHEITDGHFSLETLIDEVVRPEPAWNEVWIFRLRHIADGSAQYAQRVISAIAWQNDGSAWAGSRTGTSPQTSVTPYFVDLLLRASIADFGWPDAGLQSFEGFISVCQPSLLNFLGAFSIVHGYKEDAQDSTWKQVGEQLETLALPLQFAITKHLADLCADADRWRAADAGYTRAHEILLKLLPDPGSWESVVTVWLAILRQSLSAARRVLVGPKEAARLLDSVVVESVEAAPLEIANAALDSHVLSSHPSVKGYSALDDRVRVMRSPLLIESHTSEHAMRLWLSEKYEDVPRHWWAVLRRQTALGGAYDARSTMSLYARTLLDSLAASLHSDIRPDQFRLAVRLLVDSGKPEAAAVVKWNSELIDAYVTRTIVDDVLQRAHAYPGTTLERQRVLIELFRAWGQHLSPAAAELAEDVWRALARVARDGAVAFDGERDVARPAFDALCELAQRRPEWTTAVARDVTNAIIQKLGREETWWAHERALKAAREYIGVMDDDGARAVIVATLGLLETIPPERNAYPVVRPALGLLLTEPVKRRARVERELSEKILSTIIRFGVAQESETRRILLYLYEFDGELLRDEHIRTLVAPAVEETRRGALRTSHSDVCECIDALLLAPAISGRTGLLDALDGLQHVLESARSMQRSSPGLALAYEPILDLCSGAEDIRRELADEATWDERIEKLANEIAAVWGCARENPVLFSTFALPPATMPDPVLVHNWAFATARFGEVFGRSESLGRVLSIAATVPDLMNHVQLAQATRAIAVEHLLSGAEAVTAARSGNRESFYMALGRWLVLVETLGDKATAEELCKVLLSQVLRFGPRAVDAAVLVAAARCKLAEYARSAGLAEYSARLRADVGLNVVLQPIVGLLQGENKIRSNPIKLPHDE